MMKLKWTLCATLLLGGITCLSGCEAEPTVVSEGMTQTDFEAYQDSLGAAESEEDAVER